MILHHYTQIMHVPLGTQGSKSSEMWSRGEVDVQKVVVVDAEAVCRVGAVHRSRGEGQPEPV